MWKDPVFLASYRVRIRFQTDGTAEEYEVEFTTIRGCYRFDSRRGMMTWENGEHCVVSLMPSYMTEVIYEPVAWKHACEETYKFVYARLSVMN